MFLNKRKLISYYKKGYIDEVAKQIRMYGTINKSVEWYNETGYYAGAHRVLSILHHGLEWRLTLWNGEAKEIGYKL